MCSVLAVGVYQMAEQLEKEQQAAEEAQTHILESCQQQLEEQKQQLKEEYKQQLQATLYARVSAL